MDDPASVRAYFVRNLFGNQRTWPARTGPTARLQAPPEEIAQLRERMAALEEKIDGLSAQIQAHPWKLMEGMLRDEPLFDEWQQAMAEYRRQQDDE